MNKLWESEVLWLKNALDGYIKLHQSYIMMSFDVPRHRCTGCITYYINYITHL